MAVTVEPTGILGGAMQAIRDVIAGLTKWQTLCGVETTEDAKDYIFYQAVNAADDNMVFPNVIIMRDIYSVNRQGVGNVRTLYIEFNAITPSTYSGDDHDGDALQWMENTIGDILEDFWEAPAMPNWTRAQVHPAQRVPDEIRFHQDEVSMLVEMQVGAFA